MDRTKNFLSIRVGEMKETIVECGAKTLIYPNFTFKIEPYCRTWGWPVQRNPPWQRLWCDVRSAPRQTY